MAVISPIVASRGLDVGSAPSTARDDSVGAALRGAGRTISDVGSNLGELQLRAIKQQQQIEDFQTEQRWAQTKLQIAADYDKAKLGIDPSGAGFAQNANKAFIEQYDTFLKTVPERLRGEFSAIVATDKQGRDLQAAADEVAQRNTWYEVSINDAVNRTQSEVAAYPEQFGQKLADVNRTIEMSGLPPAKQADLKRNAEAMLGRAWFERLMQDDPSFAKTQLGVGDVGSGDAAGLIRSFEGFRTGAYFDTNAYRVGYGSDTVTRPDGSVEKVTSDTVINPMDAERDLQRRVREFEKTIIGQVGVDKWAQLPASARAGLTSVAYNYGSLPGNVVNAVKSGNVKSIAAAVDGLKGQNGGVNDNRRAREVAVILGGAEPAPQVASLPFSERIQMYDQAAAAERSVLTAQKAQATAEYAQEKGRFELGIETGEITSKQAILSSALEDSDKATLLNKLQAQQGKDAAAQTVVDAFAAGGLGKANPYDADQRKVIGDAYDLLMKATPDADRNAVTAAYVEQTGIVPAPVVATVRQGLAANDVNAVAAALQQSAALYDAAPDGVATVENGKDLMDAATTYRALVGGRGLSVAEAAAEVIKNRDPAQKLKADQLEPGWKQAVKDDAFKVEDVLKAFDGGFFGGGYPSAGITPQQSAALTADYLAAAERNYMGKANGDVALARSLAVEEMKRTYAVSETSGRRVLMKYAPELFFPARGGGHGYIRDLALADAKSIDPEATNVMLVSTPTETAADVRAGRAPRYDLYYQRPDGVWDLAPGLFTVDPNVDAQLSSLDTEETRLRLEAARELKRQQEAMPLYGSGGASQPIYPGGNYTVPPTGAAPAAAAPDLAKVSEDLKTLTQKRQSLLKQTPATATGLSMDDLLSTSIVERAKALSSPYGGPQ